MSLQFPSLLSLSPRPGERKLSLWMDTELLFIRKLSLPLREELAAEGDSLMISRCPSPHSLPCFVRGSLVSG